MERLFYAADHAEQYQQPYYFSCIAKLQAENATDFGLIMAGAALAAVPIIVVFLIFQKYFTKGITMGAVKG